MCLKPLYSLGSLLPWPQLSYLCAAPGLLLVTSMLFMTESPAHLVRYNSISGLVMILFPLPLVRTGDVTQAVESLVWLTGVSNEAARSGRWRYQIF